MEFLKEIKERLGEHDPSQVNKNNELETKKLNYNIY